MSILIRDMEIPENCMECPLDSPDCYLWTVEEFQKLRPEKDRYHERHPNCPIKEVPPHGRLIDADVLLSFDTLKTLEQIHGYADIWSIQQWICRAPTVIEAEERKQWS